MRVPLSCASTASSASYSCMCPQKQAYRAGGQRGTGFFMVSTKLGIPGVSQTAKAWPKQPPRRCLFVSCLQVSLSLPASSRGLLSTSSRGGGQVWFPVPNKDSSAVAGMCGARPPADRGTGSSPSASPVCLSCHCGPSITS